MTISLTTTNTHCTTVYRMYVGDVEIAQRALHQKYGPLVRITPNELVSSDPTAIPLIYRTQNPLAKTDWYLTFRPEGMHEITPSNHYMHQDADDPCS
jgi:hypothetical protein